MRIYVAIKQFSIDYLRTWMNLEMMQSERSQTRRAVYHRIPFIRNVPMRQIGDRKRLAVALGCGKQAGIDC